MGHKLPISTASFREEALHLGRAARALTRPFPGTVFKSGEDPSSLDGTGLSGRMVLFPESPRVSEQQVSAVLLPGCGPSKGKFAPDSAKTASRSQKEKASGCSVGTMWLKKP